MGGDHAPRALIEGVSETLAASPGTYHLLLVGDRSCVEAELSRVGRLGDDSVTVVHAEEVVHMDEAPAAAVRSKRRSSISVAVDLVKAGEADAVVSAGNTGAAVASTVVKLRMLPGIERPGIATIFPSPTGHFVLLDAGATVDCKPMHLVHYAIMGDVYSRHVLGRPEPRIGLLNVGGENSKGNELTRETFQVLSQVSNIDFVGNVEGHDLFGDSVDVVVCDGFVGNVVLKTCESLAKALSNILKTSLNRNFARKAGYLLSRGAYAELRKLSDYAEYGGAPLLGVRGTCIISHGSSSPRAIRSAIRVAGEFIRHQVNERIVARVQHVGLDSQCRSER